MDGKHPASNAQHPLKTSGLLCLLLVLCIIGVYHSVLSASFISFDDSVYVYDNPVIKGGFNLENLSRIFRFKQEAGPYWHPVTSLSHMLDVSMFGLRPGFHHLTNLIIHALNAILLFLFFQKSTGRTGPSFFIALLFAVHPLNVETVAWISERKNLLSVFFFILGLHAWRYHAGKRSGFSYLLLWIVFFSGMMSKPLMMTFPFALLLVHHFPLAAYDYSRKKPWDFVVGNIKEVKPVIQMILVMLAFFTVGFTLSETAGHVAPLTHVPLGLRLQNMAASYLIYLKMLTVPLDLTVFHPYPASVSAVTTVLSLGVLSLVSLFAFRMFNRFPWFFMGWFWYLGNSVTASGLIQKGYWPAYADRFTYLPMIGMFIVLAWGADAILSRMKAGSILPVMAGIVPSVCLAVLSHAQAGRWENAETLFRHAVTVNPGDVLSLTNLALALGEQGRLDEAIDVSEKALAIEPRYAEALNNLGTLYAKKGDYAKGLEYFNRSLEAYPGFSQARVNAEKARNILARDDTSEKPEAPTPPRSPGSASQSLDQAGEQALRLISEKQFAQAEKLYLSMLESHPEAKVSILYNLACLYAIMEQPDRAMAYLVNSIREGFSAWEHLENDKDLESLKNREDFKALIDLGKKVGKP